MQIRAIVVVTMDVYQHSRKKDVTNGYNNTKEQVGIINTIGRDGTFASDSIVRMKIKA